MLNDCLSQCRALFMPVQTHGCYLEPDSQVQQLIPCAWAWGWVVAWLICVVGHLLYVLVGPIGLYALSCVRSDISPAIYDTLELLLQVCGLLWCKVLPKRALPTLQALVLKAVCMVELNLPITERDIKLHELFELVSSIEALGAHSCCE